MLSELLAPFDYPRQSAYNVGRGLSRIGSGTAGINDYLGMAPGALGLATGAMFGLPAGVLAGGLAQGVGKMTGLEAFDAPTPSALVEALGGDPESFAQTLAAQAATDPLMYLGAGYGLRGARRALGPGEATGVSRRLPGPAEVPMAPSPLAQELERLAVPTQQTVRPPIRQPRVVPEGLAAPDMARVEADLGQINRPDRMGLRPMIPELYDSLVQSHPGLSEQAFHDMLLDMMRRDMGVPQAWGGFTGPQLESMSGHAIERFPRHPRAGYSAWFLGK